jgi:integral membrane protein
MMNSESEEAFQALRHLRHACLIEGATLLILLGVAVPLKYLAEQPMAVSVMGPAHGLAFLVYLWLVINIASRARWKKGDVVRMLGAASIPFGGIFVCKFIQQQQLIAQQEPAIQQTSTP